jgi:SAM-dependent methyltransferase
MDMGDIKRHWDTLAKKHGLDLKSTTKTQTIKRLEINAISRVIDKYIKHAPGKALLEVGCGNGHNLFGLAKLFPRFNFVGLDYSSDMIASAKILINELPNTNLRFEEGDVLSLSERSDLTEKFDLVLTDRLIINLPNWELQKQSLHQLRSCIRKGGFLIVVENFQNSYANQNKMRQLIGLPPRVPDKYNKFIAESDFEDFVTDVLGLELCYIDNFGSLHDLLLYVLLPHLSNGQVVYDHPLMQSVTDLLEKLPEELRVGLGNFGQNKLYVLQAI